jgi:folate-dependent phosphoribosylglycinamide formyltransferase PurN
MNNIITSASLINGLILNENQISLKNSIFRYNKDETPIFLDNLFDLFKLEKNNYSNLINAILENSEKFDKILLLIHFFPKKKLNNLQLKIIIDFLTIAYNFTNDIRYFNELLFFLNSEDQDYFALCVDKFQSSLENSIYHKFPKSTREEACELLKFYSKYNIIKSRENALINNIGLYGHPKGFSYLGDKLNDLGFNCQNIHLPKFNSKSTKAYKRGFITRIAFSSKFLFYFLNIIKKPSFKSTIIDEKSNSLILGKKISKFNFDIALHRLYGIIRSNLFKNSGLGILNDHVGFLPFLRGWSTIEYAILFGFPIASTIHFVDEGVDTGKIIKVFPLQFKKSTPTLDDIITVVCENNYQRILEVIENLNRSEIDYHKNDINKGYQFFRMHEILKAYVENICIENKFFNFYEETK